MILTLVCLKPDEYIVVAETGYVSIYRTIELKPASSREGDVVYHGNHHNAMMFIVNRNHK